MAGSKYAYVKSFELPDSLLPSTFLVARLDGHGFHRFSDAHGFVKPNDERALQLMDHAARNVMEEYHDIVLAFGESDEYSFLLRKSCSLYNRRASKIITTLTSLFTASYVMLWSQYFPSTQLAYPPSFDGRIIMYPGETEIRDYFSWRQTDTHINNLYNTVFWALVLQGGQTKAQAHETLRGTISSTKNDILFERFNINYSKLPARFRKGSVLIRVENSQPDVTEAPQPPEHSYPESTLSSTTEKPSSAPQVNPITRSKKMKHPYEISVLHCDIISDTFWAEHPEILA